MIKQIITAGLSLVLCVGASAIPAPVSAAGNMSCQQKTTTVTLSPTDTTAYQVQGWLCWQGSLHNKTVQLVVHGLSYDHNYWDWPYQPGQYSYVHRAVDAGYATFNIDRLGDGLSSKPPADSLTAFSGAYVAHQLVQELRTGHIGGTAFEKVVIVGHSFGSVTSVIEAGTYHDVDAVLLSGFAHELDPNAFSNFSIFYPAQLDPKFASAGLPDGYFTSMPGTRGGPLFYNAANTDPNVVALDEQLKQTYTTGEQATVVAANDPVYSLGITVPVLMVLGQQDVLFCNQTNLSCADNAAVLARENQYFTPQACLETYVLPASGHDVNLHRNAKQWFQTATDWTNRRVGTGSHGATQPC